MVELTLTLAFVAGIISFLSPCVLPLIPAFLTFLAGSSAEEAKQNPKKARIKIFINTILFVLGFTFVFALLGVLLQSVLSSIAFDLRNILGYIGGIIIIIFGLTLMGVVKIPALDVERKIHIKKEKFPYISSFVFGAAFAVGWTPCVGAILGSVLTLAVTDPTIAFPLMLSYSAGLTLPFLITGLFVGQASGLIAKISPHLKTLNVIFGLILVILGILVFTNTLSLVANFFFIEQVIMQ